MDKDSTTSPHVISFAFEASSVRVQEIAGAPWFCAMDICSILGYRNDSDAVKKHCREAGVAKRDLSSGGQKRTMSFLDEGNLYRLIIKSRKAEAQRFEAWVCDEVLPAIRKHGHYEEPVGRMATLIGQTIGTDGFHMLGAIIKGKVSSLPSAHRRRAMAKIWSQTHAAFGVRSAEDIPSNQLDSARNFIAAYSLEGEWLPKPESENVVYLDEQQALALKSLTHNAAWVAYHWHEGIGASLKAAQSNLYGNARTRVLNLETRIQHLKIVTDRIVAVLGPSYPPDFFGLNPEECDDPRSRGSWGWP